VTDGSLLPSLEGVLMISRLERNREALLTAQSHLDRYLTKRFEAGGNVPERHVSPQRGERP